MATLNSFGAASKLRAGASEYTIYRLDALDSAVPGGVSRLPFSIKILIENLLRNEDDRFVRSADIVAAAQWDGGKTSKEINFMPARVLLQDFTGVPAVVDLAAMRDALRAMGADPALANPLLPADLVIDHSVQVDHFGNSQAMELNTLLEYQRNSERYSFLRWGQTAFKNFRVVPPETGIVHQVNLEYLASVVFRGDRDGQMLAYPDTVVGTDSHTTMINGLGVVGWGVGGIEAEACMLGQPISMLLPQVIGFHLSGELPRGATATDLVLRVTEILRKRGVVGKFVEFYGKGLSSLGLADRATIANMAPEYGATIGFFPIDDEALRYLRLTGRSAELVELVEAYTKEQGLFRTDATPDPIFTDTIELDLATVQPALAGPKRPQDRVNLPDVKNNFQAFLGGDPKQVKVSANGEGSYILEDGAVVIAAITSCTNTSNPSVLIGAGLLAKKAVERGLRVKPWVKTSLAPGSRAVNEYLQKAGLLPYLEQLGFHVVGYGCTTCIGNSGPLPEKIAEAVSKEKMVVAAVLSGNRNFEGRINPHVRANYLASPPLVVAYAIAGSMHLDLQNEPLGQDTAGNNVYLRDLWPSPEQIRETIATTIDRDLFSAVYSEVFTGGKFWNAIQVPEGDLYDWDDSSTYIKRAPYFERMPNPASSVQDLTHLRVLAVLGDSVTTDHISPAGSIPKDSPAGKYLISQGVKPADFNSYGARRGNHEVMVRGTLANIRLRNQLAPGTEGGYTRLLPGEDVTTIYEASIQYQSQGVPLMILAGKEYGSGSSRDWAAKGVQLLGVRAVLAESFERIHRSNLVGMGVLPLEFQEGQSRESLGLTGEEVYSVLGVVDALAGTRRAKVVAKSDVRGEKVFEVVVRVDTPMEAEYYRYGGILTYVLQQLARPSAVAQ